MRINEYNSLDEFIDEYGSGEWNPSLGHYIGIEFKYKNKSYRMCCEPNQGYSKEEAKAPFHVYQIIDIDKSEYLTIGMYSSLQEVLNNCLIDGVLFKDVIMDDSTYIDSKD